MLATEKARPAPFVLVPLTQQETEDFKADFAKRLTIYFEATKKDQEELETLMAQKREIEARQRDAEREIAQARAGQAEARAMQEEGRAKLTMAQALRTNAAEQKQEAEIRKKNMISKL